MHNRHNAVEFYCYFYVQVCAIWVVFKFLFVHWTFLWL